MKQFRMPRIIWLLHDAHGSVSGMRQFGIEYREKLAMHVECTAAEDDLDGYREKLTRLLGRIGKQ